MNNECECYACRAPDPATELQKFIAYVHGQGGYWSAHDQGKLAALEGRPRESNPWDGAISGAHVNCGDWFRGYDSAKF